jgi:hypothetical protein
MESALIKRERDSPDIVSYNGKLGNGIHKMHEAYFGSRTEMICDNHLAVSGIEIVEKVLTVGPSAPQLITEAMVFRDRRTEGRRLDLCWHEGE